MYITLENYYSRYLKLFIINKYPVNVSKIPFLYLLNEYETRFYLFLYTNIYIYKSQIS